MAREIIAAAPRIEGCPFVFTTNASTTISGFSKIKRRLDAMMNIAPWRVHDLRRTAVTMMAEIGILPHVIEAVVNHISGHKGGVAGTYQPCCSMLLRREPLWSDGQPTSKILQLTALRKLCPSRRRDDDDRGCQGGATKKPWPERVR